MRQGPRKARTSAIPPVGMRRILIFLALLFGTTACGGGATGVAPPQQHTLAVAGSGTGSGTVTSSPSGISCTITAGTPSGTCSASYAAGTSVTLTATPAPGHTFTGWSGPCSGTGPCTVTMTQDRSVTAGFEPPPPGGNPAIGEPQQYADGRLVLRQQAANAYFVALNHVQSESPGSYSLTAIGTTATAAGLRRHSNDDPLGHEWRVVELGNKAADRLAVPPRPWTTSVRPASVGSQRSFWVCVSDPCRWADGGQAQITATLQAIGSTSLIYVDNRDLATIPISRAEVIRDVFDSETWPRLTAVFGKPINPYNPTGDGPTIILFSRTVREYGPAGYFRAINLFPDSDAQRWGYRSNEASMFYMAPDLSDTFIHAINAHEFQHLINYSQKRFVYGATTSESTWINEGLSMVAEDVAGWGYQRGTVQGFARTFMNYADVTSLYNWGHPDAPIGAYYGAGWLIFRYIADRFGDGALTNVVQSRFVGVANVERVTGEPIGRTLVYNGVAMLVSIEGLGLTDPRWTYRSVSLATIGRIAYGGTGAKTVRSLGFNFVAVSSGGQPAVSVTVTAGTSTPYAGLVR